MVPPLAAAPPAGVGLSRDPWLGPAQMLRASASALLPPVPYQPSLMLERVSLKVYNCLPQELLPVVRAQLDQLVSSSACLLEGAIRPGCTHLTLTAFLPAPAEGQHAGQESQPCHQSSELLCGAGPVHGRLPALLGGHGPLASLLRVKGAVVQGNGQVAVVRAVSSGSNGVRLAGEVGAAAPVLAALSPPCVYAPATPCAAAGSVVEVRGRHVSPPSGALLCRQQGMHLAVEVHAWGRHGQCTEQQDQQEWVHMRPVGLLPGCAEVEAQAGVVLGESRPLLALPCRAAVEEVCALVAATVQAAAADESPAAAAQAQAAADAFLREVGIVVQYTHRRVSPAGACGTAGPADSRAHGQVVATLARGLVVAVAARGCPALAALLLEGVCADGCTAAEAMAGADATCGPASSLLHAVVGSGCPQLVPVLQRWGARHGIQWRLCSGDTGVPLASPANVACALPDRNRVLIALAALDADVACRRSAKPTPGCAATPQLAVEAEEVLCSAPAAGELRAEQDVVLAMPHAPQTPRQQLCACEAYGTPGTDTGGPAGPLAGPDGAASEQALPRCGWGTTAVRTWFENRNMSVLSAVLCSDPAGLAQSTCVLALPSLRRCRDAVCAVVADWPPLQRLLVTAAG